MCRPYPVPRCSTDSRQKLALSTKRRDDAKEELDEYEAKYADSLANADPSKRDAIRIAKHERLKAELAKQEDAVTAAEFTYNATPAGQDELREGILQAEEAGDYAMQEELEARLDAARQYRESLKSSGRKLKEIEKEEGPEAAVEAGWEMYEQAVEEEVQATEDMTAANIELDAAREEAAEYDRAMEEYRKNDRIDTPEEEAEKRRKKKIMLLTIGTIAAAVITYSLIRQGATGKQSQMMQYGRSMMMRQVMTGGRQFIMPLLNNGEKEADARERRAEQEAEHRAAAARERVLKNHEKTVAEEDRQKAKVAEREEAIAFRRRLAEEERESARKIREDEIAHYNKLSDIELPPHVIEEIKARYPQAARQRAADTARNQRNRQEAQTTKMDAAPVPA